MSDQLSLAIDQPAAPGEPPPRRIDITLDRVRDVIEGMAEQDRRALSGQPWWPHVNALIAVRAMERAEELVNAADGRRHRMVYALADTYDQIVKPGEHPIEALLRVWRGVYGARESE